MCNMCGMTLNVNYHELTHCVFGENGGTCIILADKYVYFKCVHPQVLLKSHLFERKADILK